MVGNRENTRHAAGYTTGRTRCLQGSRGPGQSSGRFALPSWRLTPKSDFREKRKGSRSRGGHEPPPGRVKSTPALGPTFRWESSTYLPRNRKPTTRSHAHSPRPFSRPSGLERALTRSQADSSRRGGNPRSPRTGISGASPAWAPLFLVVRAADQSSDPKPGLRHGRPLGPTPLSLLPPPTPRRSAAPLRRQPDPGNSQMGRYHPRAAGGCGEGSQAQSSRPPPLAVSQATPGRGREGAAAAARGRRGPSGPRPPRLTPRPGRRDGSLRGAH